MKKSNKAYNKLVNILSDGQYHDGTALGESLGMSRAAVWKHIKKLESFGVSIDSIKGRGYKINEPLMLLEATTIKKQIRYRPIKVEVFEEIDSTHEYLKTFDGKETRVCVAEKQTGGRARLNRNWFSPYAQNIYMSIRLTLDNAISELSGLSLAVGVAIAECLDEVSNTDAQAKVKWPNDVYINDKKIAGCLLDVQAEAHGQCCVIIGMGVNVNMTKGSRTINQPWTSLAAEGKEYIDRNRIVSALVNRIIDTTDIFSEHGLAAFTKKWDARDYLKGREVEMLHHKKPLKGRVHN